VTNLDQASVQAMSDAAEAGDNGPAFECLAENILVENGPGGRQHFNSEGEN
jgi:hypothetical protein